MPQDAPDAWRHRTIGQGKAAAFSECFPEVNRSTEKFPDDGGREWLPVKSRCQPEGKTGQSVQLLPVGWKQYGLNNGVCCQVLELQYEDTVAQIAGKTEIL